MKGLDLQLPSPIVELHDDRLAQHGVQVFLKRDDLIHPDIPGNKWRKLKYNLAAAKEQGESTLLTFGGAYSNHIRATAAAGYYLDFDTIGVIRGEEHNPLNESLRYAARMGMKLAYLDRATYRNKKDQSVIADLRDRMGGFYLIPEGGTNTFAVQGCRELVEEIDLEFDAICCACGTGGTLAGIASGLTAGQQAVGFSALKGGEFLTCEVADLQRTALGYSTNNWAIETKFHFGGFAKRTAELDDFIESFEQRHAIRLEWTYVAKMMYGIYTLVHQRRFRPGSRIVCVITG